MSEAEIANRVAPEMNTIAAKTILLVFFALLLARPASTAEGNADSEKADVARQNADDVAKQKADDVANDLIGAFPLSTHWGQLVQDTVRQRSSTRCWSLTNIFFGLTIATALAAHL